MILIFSTENQETTTEEVIDWLNFSNCKFIRLNGEIFENEVMQVTFHEEEVFGFRDKKLNDANVIWNRRWWRDNSLDAILKSNLSVKNAYYLHKYLRAEYFELSKFLFHTLRKKKWIDDKNVSDSFNKLITLSLAKKIGLKIPNTIVTNDHEVLKDFFSKNTRVITKPISNVVGFDHNNGSFTLETREVNLKDLEDFSEERFFVSLFQELIEKKYEIRTFYLNGKFYSMAIFSQRRKEASIDYRVYDFQNPDRMVPYILPNTVEEKLLELVNQLGFKHCSIDCIVTKSNDIYFLEINPVGQFGMVSKPCNYFLEKEMANFLRSQI
ncbi:MAG: grasp-with-spasm system ATP-grasp peptide maturase [Daejeonella sp.]